MALNSRMEPMICLKWVTVRPYYVGDSRLSPDFSILNSEWYFELKITVYSCYCHYEIWIHPRPSPSPSNYLLAVDTELNVRGTSFYQSENLRNNTQSICILKKSVNEGNISSSGNKEEWVVICTFKVTDACKSFSLQVGNKTVILSSGNKNLPNTSVDECVQVSQEVPHNMEALSSDISSLLEKEILPDFKLECGGQSFPVHRSVLSARSEVFRAMFQNRMQESETGSVDIKDLEVPVLQSMLKFMYSGKLEDISDDTADGIYEAADKYAVPSLRKACSYWMERNLSEENCIVYLSIADSHSDLDLRAGIISFIVKHPEIFNDAAWLTFSEQQPALANRVFQAYFKPVTQ